MEGFIATSPAPVVRCRPGLLGRQGVGPGVGVKTDARTDPRTDPDADPHPGPSIDEDVHARWAGHRVIPCRWELLARAYCNTLASSVATSATVTRSAHSSDIASATSSRSSVSAGGLSWMLARV
jgi:hypothetical protein